MIARMPLGFAKPAPVPAVSLIVAAATCFVLAGCSPGADYPSFPGVHDRPPARSDTPLDRNQVQQATEDLISARDRLSAEAQSGQGKTSTKPASAQSAITAAAKKPPNAAPPTNSAARQAVGDGTQRTSAETK
jgi:hypothetical protein